MWVKMMIKITRLLIALVFAPALAMAQPAGAPLTSDILFHYDIDSATETFCALGPIVSGTVAVSASASTNLTGTAAFTNVLVGAMLHIVTPTATYDRGIAVRTSANAVVISGAAITVTDAVWSYRNPVCSTTLASMDGSFNVSRYNSALVTFNVAQQVATGGIDVRLVCIANALSTWVQVWPAQTDTTAAAAYINYTTGTVAQKAIPLSDPYTRCKVGFKIGSADDGDDLTTNAEAFSVFVAGR